MHKLKGIQLSVDELKTLKDAYKIIMEMQDATRSESLMRLCNDMGGLIALINKDGVYTALDKD